MRSFSAEKQIEQKLGQKRDVLEELQVSLEVTYTLFFIRTPKFGFRL